MKKLFLFLALTLISSNSYSRTWSRISIFVCEPHWGALAREIVGDEAEIIMGTVANENPMRISANPELFSRFREADLVFCSGGGLEDNWLPTLFNQSGNVKVFGDEDRKLMADDYVKKIAIVSNNNQVDPNLNSYAYLNPNNISLVAEELLKRLKKIDATRDYIYQKNYDKFRTEWDKKIQRWESKIVKLKNMPVVITNNSWNHLVSWMNLKVVGVINKDTSRVLVNSNDIGNLVKLLEINPAEMIITSPYDEEKRTAYVLYDRTKIRVTILPNTVYQKVNKRLKIATLERLFDEIVEGMLRNPGRNDNDSGYNIDY